MPGYSNMLDRFTLALGLREPTAWERVQRFDWHDYAPSRPSMPSMDYRLVQTYDTSSLIIGLAVGVGVGIGLGYALKGNVAPTAKRVRERTTEALEGIQNRLPERLRVTRMEEEPAGQRG